MASAAPSVSSDVAKSIPPKDLDKYREEFSRIDADNSGRVDAAELADAAAALGNKLSNTQVKALVAQADLDDDGKISFDEFAKLMAAAKASGKSEHLMFVKGEGTAHSFSREECAAFSEHVNYTLGDDEFLKDRLPIDPNSMDLFKVISDGILLCKLINVAAPDTVDERALVFPKKGKALNVWEMSANANVAISSARAVGCKVVNIHTATIMKTVETDAYTTALGLIWQLVRLTVTKSINLKSSPEIAQLREGDEELADLMRLKPEVLLLRWFNYHLAKAGVSDRVKNFSSDLKDGSKYVTLLNSIAPECIGKAVAGTPEKRATTVIGAAKSIGVPVIIKPKDITNGDKNLNLAFVAEIFNTRTGLEEVSEAEQKSLADLLGDEDDATSREERVFRQWINSLHLDDMHIENVFDDLNNGLNLLKAIDAVEPGTVKWKKVNKKVPMMKFKKGENCQYAVKLGKDLGFSLVGIGGTNIMDGDKKPILAFLWQLMRYHLLKMLRELGGGTKIDDHDIVAWANATAATTGSSVTIKNTKDKKLKDGRYLLHLVAAIEPRAVDFKIVTACTDDKEYELNAKYVVSVARAVGASIFLTWEDIVEVNSKLLLALLACLMLRHTEVSGKAGKK